MQGEKTINNRSVITAAPILWSSPLPYSSCTPNPNKTNVWVLSQNEYNKWRNCDYTGEQHMKKILKRK
ncbi:MAG: hypothetical protein ACR2IS_09880 [Nitrososphaeraceae archaeon]